MRRTKHIFFGVYLVMIASFAFTGCKKKDGGGSSAKASIKITVTATGATAEDQIRFAVQAGNHDTSQYGELVWKTNGVSQGNQNLVFVDQDDFLGTTKTYVFETVKPFNFGSLNVTCVNQDGAPITISYKAEVNGQVETNVQNLVVSQGENKAYTYVAK